MAMQKKHMLQKLEPADILDIIWDCYLPQSLKQATKHKRGSNYRVYVKECTPVPSNLGTFLKLEQKKNQIFYFLAERIGSVATEGKQLLYLKTIERLRNENTTKNTTQ